MKTQATRSVYLSFSGSSGTLTIPLPDKGRIVGVDFAFGFMVGELAAATGISYVSVFLGTPVAGSNGNTSTNLLASIYQPARSNASQALIVPLGKFVSTNVPFAKNAVASVDYVAFSNHQLSGWVTLYLESA